MITDYQKYLITTAIDYTNDVIHLGHSFQKILADSIARFYRLKHGENNVFFVTGTDEHGSTSEKAAKKLNMSPMEFVTGISLKDKNQQDLLNVSYDRFIRTTDEDHKKTAQEFYNKAFENGDIYKSTYQGLYCEGCESYKTLSDLNDDGQCLLHPTREIQKINEENYFFAWSKYSDFLLELLEKPDFILPENKKNEMVAFVKSGLKDIPISRPTSKVSWGIPVPNDSEHVLYVWFDALINYYTAAYPKGFWTEDTKILHILGKDNARWHALLWPAMLKSCGFKVPSTVYVHGFMNLNGQKISKSLGNVILASDLVEQYGSDAIRFYLLKHGPITEDVDISIEHFKQVYNADLANGLGNLVARISKLAEKSGFQFNLQFDNDLYNSDVYEPLQKNYRVDLTINNILSEISKVDKNINQTEPWKITDQDKLFEVLNYQAEQILKIAKLLQPFIPSASKKIVQQFTASKITSGKPLFPRI